MERAVGQVLSVDGIRIVATASEGGPPVTVGTIVKMQAGDREVFGTVRTVSFDGSHRAQRTMDVDLLGEVRRVPGDGHTFRRGISRYPAIGVPVLPATPPEIATMYARPGVPSIRMGALAGDESQPAYVMIDELLAKHFAVLGATGSGKSCALTVILSSILADQPNAHVILIDPHNEYSHAFGSIAHVVDVENLQLPFWLFDLEEAVRILVRGGTAQEQEAQAIILKDAIADARRQYAEENHRPSGSITVDTPVPFRIPDLLRNINEAAGRLNKPDTARPYLRLYNRIESLRDDKRFAFMFTGPLELSDTLSQVIAQLLRIPVKGRPLTILDLSGIPSEIADVVVSLSFRIVFDFILWSEPDQRAPVLVVCEEAHRYVPADERSGFGAATRAITRIAKEGRKYGISLALVSQRPSELSAQALAQCGTVIALRMSSEIDQQFIAKALGDVSRSMLRMLPNLPVQEAIVFGEAVSVPMRVRLEDLPHERRPHSESAVFSQAWQNDAPSAASRDAAIERWRQQMRRNP